MRLKLPLILLIVLSSVMTQAYELKEGETLASVVRKFYVGKVFGKDGGLEKLLSINKHIKDPNNVPPGTYVRLNKELLKPGIEIKEDPAEVAAARQEEIAEAQANAANEAEADSAAGLSPLIEIEKYNDPKNQMLKAKPEDKLSFYTVFRYNALEGKNQTTQNTYSFNTSSETEIGFEYSKYMSEKSDLYGILSLNEFSIADVSTTTPTLERSRKAQASAAVGGRYWFTEGNFVGYSFNYRPHFYLIENLAGNMELQHLLSTSIGLDIENQVYNNNVDFIIGYTAGLEYITNPQNPGSGGTDGLGFNFGLVYQQDFKDNDKLRVKLNYSRVNLDSSTYNLVSNTIALNFLYSLPY